MLTLRISQHWVEQLTGELEKAGTREIGGILMAEQLAPGEFAIVEMSFQRRGGSFASFVRSARHAWVSLTRFFKRTDHRYTRFNYIGEWHSHPSFSVQPSSTDHASMMALVNDDQVRAEFLVLLIVRLAKNELELSLTGYQPDQFPVNAELIIDRYR